MMYPSARLAVDLPAEDIPVEELYALFRQYGRIHTLTVDKKVARVTFGTTRCAVAGTHLPVIQENIEAFFARCLYLK